jgi:hypothetical protein
MKQQHPLQKPLIKKACMKCSRKLDMQILDQNVTWLLEELTKTREMKRQHNDATDISTPRSLRRLEESLLE